MEDFMARWIACFPYYIAMLTPVILVWGFALLLEGINSINQKINEEEL